MTSRELSTAIGVQDNTLRHWRCTGTGPPFVRVGQAVRYRIGDVERWLEERTVQPGAVS
jgi:predicted DNA-binding transcriptional regulator AlpA